MTSQFLPALVVFFASGSCLAADGPIDVGSRLELFTDGYMIESLDGAELRLNAPTPQEVAIVHTHALDKTEALRQPARHLFSLDKTPLFAEVVSVIGAHIGPGVVGFVAIKARQ